MVLQLNGTKNIKIFMKKHYYLNGREVSKGDYLSFTIRVNGEEMGSCGEAEESDLELLAKAGILDVQELTDDIDVSEDPMYYVSKVCERLDINPDNRVRFIGELLKFSESSLSSLILKEIAIELDKKYPGHIKNCYFWYCLNVENFEPIKVERNTIIGSVDNFTSKFAVFRTKFDAWFGAKVLGKLIALYRINPVHDFTYEPKDKEC